MRYSGFHRAIGILHGEHKATWPIHFTNEIETAKLDELRQRYKDAGQTPPSFTSMVVKAIALAVNEVSGQFPEINAYLKNFFGWKTIHDFDRISAGVAISRNEDGLDRAMTAVVQDPEAKPLTAITKELRDAATLPVQDVPYMKNCYYLFRAPKPIQWLMLLIGRSFPETRRLYRGTFTLTSVGKFGVDQQVTLPQASSLQFGFGVIRPRPVVHDGQVVSARTFYLTSSFDRRLMNGRPVAEMMEKVRDILNTAAFDDWDQFEAPAAERAAETTSAAGG